MKSLINLAVVGWAAIATAIAFGEDEVKVFNAIGVIGEVSDAGFKWKTKSGSFNASYASNFTVVRFGVSTMEGLSDGAKVHVLGRFHDSRPTSDGGRMPPEITQVQVVVVGQGFEPPPVGEKLRENKLQWVTGIVRTKSKSKQVLVDNAVLQYGSAKPVIVIEKAERAQIAKGSVVFATGLPTGEKKGKELTISRVAIFHAEIKAEIYPMLVPL